MDGSNADAVVAVCSNAEHVAVGSKCEHDVVGKQACSKLVPELGSIQVLEQVHSKVLEPVPVHNRQGLEQVHSKELAPEQVQNKVPEQVQVRNKLVLVQEHNKVQVLEPVHSKELAPERVHSKVPEQDRLAYSKSVLEPGSKYAEVGKTNVDGKNADVEQGSK